MKITTLGSGSKGNCTVVCTENTVVLIDAGLPIFEIEAKLVALGTSPTKIDGILITHEHSDHIKSVERLSKKYNTKIYAHQKLWPALNKKLPGILAECKLAFDNNDFFVGDLTISNFELSHDSSHCVGYSFFCQGAKFSIATDLGHCPPNIVQKLKGSNLVVLEANHDEMLVANNAKYPISLKRRILSNKGHLSNKACAEVISQLVGETHQIVLAHLSEENNSPAHAYNQIKTLLAQKGIVEGQNIFIDVASQHQIGNVFEIKFN